MRDSQRHSFDDRRNLHVRLTDDAYEGLEDVCREAGITMTALLEAAGMYYAAGGRPSREFIAEAQRVDHERRHQRGRKRDH